ncbi:MAG: hypothetical protein IAI49_00775, partial [Candidatus Eremiobacteraeota bacterium]|nr:hypothetical protein [Candidatus Eremiobacteraeota bacterium]
MYYLDFLRVRRALKVFAIFVGGALAFVLVSLPFSHVNHGDPTIGISSEAIASHSYSGISMLHQLGQQATIPFKLLCATAALIAIFFASGCSLSLSRFNSNLH